MTKANKLKEAYELISGELSYLPNKKWKTISEYKEDFSYIKDKNILKQISKFKMTLDYSASLYELHKPLGPMAEIHFLSLSQIIGSICEAMLRDFLYFKIENMNEIVRKKFSRPMLSELLGTLKDYLSEKDKSYLGNIKKLRDTIHINYDTDSIKYIEETGYLKVEKIKDDFLGGVLIKKNMNVLKLLIEFENFYKRFLKYYK